MDKFKLAHTTKTTKIAKPIQKPKPRYFQKKIKDLLTAAPVSTSDTRQAKNKENAVKFLTNEAGGKEEDRSTILHMLKKKKSKNSKKKKKDVKYDSSHSKGSNSEQEEIKRIEENTTNLLHKEPVVKSPKKNLYSLESAKYVAKEVHSDNFKINLSKSVKKHKKEIAGSYIKQLKSPKTDSPQVPITFDISNKSSPKTNSDKTIENILSSERITDVEQQHKTKKSKKAKSHKNKKHNIGSAPLETKDIQNDTPLDLNKKAKNKEDSSEQKVGKIGHLHQKKTPKFVCKKSFISKSEHIKPTPVLKMKKKTKKDKIGSKEKKQKISSKKGEVDSNCAIQEHEWTSGPLPSDPLPILSEKTMFSSKINKRKPKKKKKSKIQLTSASDIDIGLGVDIENHTELNNSITSIEVDNVPSHIIEGKESTQKKKAFKKKKKDALLFAEKFSTHSESTVSEIQTLSAHPQFEEAATSSGFNVEVIEHVENTVPEIGTSTQSAHLGLEQAANNRFNVEIIEIDDSESNSSFKADIINHKKAKENGEPSRTVSSSMAAAEQDSCKRPKGKKIKKLTEKLDSIQGFLETYRDYIVDIEEPKKQSRRSSGEQQLDSAPLVVDVVNGVELPKVPDIFHNIDNIRSSEGGREIHSVIQEFISDVSEAQSTFLKPVAKQDKKMHKQTSANDSSPVLATEYRSKTRKRKLTGEHKYPENINIQQKDGTTNKIPSEPLIISAAANTESFQIPPFLDTVPTESLASNENVTDVHSVIQSSLLGSQEKDSFYEMSISSNSELKGTNETLENTQEENVDENTSTKAKADSRSPTRKKKLSENVDSGMEITSESFEVPQDLEEEENCTTKVNVSEPLLIEMMDVVPKMPAIFNCLPTESVSATEEVHSNSLIEHLKPTSFRDDHLGTVVSSINNVTTNKRKKKERNIKQQKQQNNEADDVETEEDSVKFYSVPSCSKFLLFMKYPSLLYFKGKLTVSVLSGIIEVLGCVMKSEENSMHVVYSPKGSSLMSLQTCESDENEVVDYVALTEKLTKLGMSTLVTKDILTNLGQRDCLILLEEGPTINLEEVLKRLPPDMHFFDVSNENRKERNPASCLYKAQKKLGCIFESPSSDKSFRRYTKSPQWDVLVQDIISCNVENLQNGPVSTVVCGGKGVGKSTFLRYFVNKCIIEFGKVLWLDFDPGQAEFVMPGCVAAVVIDEPLMGPNFTHLKKAERMVFVGDVNISQCPIQYLESVRHVINYCRSHSELKRIPWLANTMGFCKGLGIDLTTSIIRLLNPHKVVQIQSESFKRNFPELLSREYVANYPSMWRTGPAPGRVTLKYDMHVINTMTDSRVVENTGHWGMEPRRLREAMMLSYLSQMVEPPGYSIYDIVPYVTPFHKLTLCICHKPIQYAHMLSAMNGNLVALCRYDGNEALVPNDPQLPKVMNRQPVCPCLGFGIVRGIDTQEKNLFLVTPVSREELQQVNCLMMGAIMLPAYVYTTAESGMGQVPYVSAGPGQPTSKVIRRFFRPLEEKTVHRDRHTLNV